MPEFGVKGRLLVGLYLCVFEGDEEIDGVEIGAYADFNGLREYVVRELEEGQAGVKFPTFMLHPDSDGEWAVSECVNLSKEVMEITLSMITRPPVPFISDWQKSAAKSVGLVPKNAFESFIDVDGEFVLERIQHLINVAIQHQLPILFQ